VPSDRVRWGPRRSTSPDAFSRPNRAGDAELRTTCARQLTCEIPRCRWSLMSTVLTRDARDRLGRHVRDPQAERERRTRPVRRTARPRSNPRGRLAEEPRARAARRRARPQHGRRRWPTPGSRPRGIGSGPVTPRPRSSVPASGRCRASRHGPWRPSAAGIHRVAGDVCRARSTSSVRSGRDPRVHVDRRGAAGLARVAEARPRRPAAARSSRRPRHEHRVPPAELVMTGRGARRIRRGAYDALGDGFRAGERPSDSGATTSACRPPALRGGFGRPPRARPRRAGSTERSRDERHVGSLPATALPATRLKRIDPAGRERVVPRADDADDPVRLRRIPCLGRRA
jgi:hypothetical protein